MDSIRNKLRNWISNKWNYEIQCDVFEELDVVELQKLASMYGIDISLSRIQICNKLAEILEKKRKEYKIILDKSTCSNTMDPISGTNVEDIDPRNLVTLEQNGRTYCFETEGIYTYITNVKKINPYTKVPFEESQISQINDEYARYKTLKGKKFDEDAYATDTNLTAIVSQLSSYLPYTVGINKFVAMDLNDVNKFLNILEDFYVYIDVKPTELKQYKIQIAQKLVKWVLNNANNDNLRQAWNHYQSGNIESFIITGDLVMVRSILETSNLNVERLLEIAIKYSQFEIVKYLVETAGAYLNNKIIFTAVRSKNLDILRYLVEEKGMDINIKDNYENSLIHIAYEDSNFDIIRYLEDKGLNIDDEQKLVLTIQNGDLDILKYLVEEKGLNIINTLPLATNLHTIRYLVENGADINAKDENGRTVLHNNIVIFRNIQVIIYLLKNDIDINAKDNEGHTALTYLLQNLRSYGYDEDDINNILDIVEYLIEKGIDLNIKTNKGLTALDLATKLEQDDILDIINRNLKPSTLHDTVSKLDLKNIKRLIEEDGVDINVKDNEGNTSLTYLLDFLTKHRSYTREREDINNILDIVEYLIEKGIDLNIKTNKGLTALDLATKLEQDDILDIISRANRSQLSPA